MAEKKMNGTLPKYDNPEWENWRRIRRLPLARRAADEGWAWALRCQVLDGKIKTSEQINPAEFLARKKRTDDNEFRVLSGQEMIMEDGSPRKLRSSFVTKYLEGRRGLLMQEARAVEEIVGPQTVDQPDPYPRQHNSSQDTQGWESEPLDHLIDGGA